MTAQNPPGTESLRKALEVHFAEELLPLWEKHITCSARAGALLGHDRAWNVRRPSTRVVAQARCLWFWSRLCRSPFAEALHRDNARAVFEYMERALWDGAHGGYLWAAGRRARFGLRVRGTETAKHVCGQAFALYGLSEYAKTCGDERALKRARELFDLLESKALDRQAPGYHEQFGREWNRAPQEARFIGTRGCVKTLNTHLHLMEAFTAYAQVSEDSLVGERLRSLIALIEERCRRPETGAYSVAFSPEWERLEADILGACSYGHDIETVWLVLEARRRAGMGVEEALADARQTSAHARRWGWDVDRGGYFGEGPPGAPPTDRTKTWWAHAEGLTHAAAMLRVDPGGDWLTVLEETWACIRSQFIDRTHGGWFSAVKQYGLSNGDKTGHWRTPYHDGRALLGVLQVLGGGESPW